MPDDRGHAVLRRTDEPAISPRLRVDSPPKGSADAPGVCADGEQEAMDSNSARRKWGVYGALTFSIVTVVTMIYIVYFLMPRL